MTTEQKKIQRNCEEIRLESDLSEKTCPENCTLGVLCVLVVFSVLSILSHRGKNWTGARRNCRNTERARLLCSVFTPALSADRMELSENSLKSVKVVG